MRGEWTPKGIHMRRHLTHSCLTVCVMHICPLANHTIRGLMEMNARIDKMQNSPVPFFLHFLCWTRNTNLITLFNFKAVVSKVRSGDSYSFWSKVLSKRRKPQINQCPFRGLGFKESSTTPDLKLLIALELFLNHWYQNIESFAAWITDTYMTSTLPEVKNNVLTSVSHCIRHPLIKSCPLTSSIKDGRNQLKRRDLFFGR